MEMGWFRNFIMIQNLTKDTGNYSNLRKDRPKSTRKQTGLQANETEGKESDIM